MRKLILLTFLLTFSFSVYPQDVLMGCTNEQAENYSEGANYDDGSCYYTETILLSVANECEYVEDIFSMPIVVHKDVHINGNNLTIIEMFNFSNGTSNDITVQIDGSSIVPYSIFTDGELEWEEYSIRIDISGYIEDGKLYLINNWFTLQGGEYVPYSTCEAMIYSNFGDVVFACTDLSACNYNSEAQFDDASCEYPNLEAGLINQISEILEHDYLESEGLSTHAFFEQGSGTFTQGTNVFVQGTNLFVQGTDLLFSGFSLIGDEIYNYVQSIFQTIDSNPDIIDCEQCEIDINQNGICDELELNVGCTNSQALNYNSYANYDNGSCMYEDITAFYLNDNCDEWMLDQLDYNIYINNNYLTLVGLLETYEGISGDITFEMENGMFLNEYTISDAYSELTISGQINGNDIILLFSMNYDGVIDECEVILSSVDPSLVFGCIDEQACNYNLSATHSDGSCDYLLVNIDSIPNTDIYVLMSDDELTNATYSWYFNGDLIPNETNNYLVAEQNGVYELVVLNLDNDCEASSSIELFNVSIEESALNTFNLYPNPANDYIIISFENTIKDGFIVELTNILGERIKYIESDKFDSNELYISTSSLEPGTYFVSLKLENSLKSQKLFMVVE